MTREKDLIIAKILAIKRSRNKIRLGGRRERRRDIEEKSGRVMAHDIAIKEAKRAYSELARNDAKVAQQSDPTARAPTQRHDFRDDGRVGTARSHCLERYGVQVLLQIKNTLVQHFQLEAQDELAADLPGGRSQCQLVEGEVLPQPDVDLLRVGQYVGDGRPPVSANQLAPHSQRDVAQRLVGNHANLRKRFDDLLDGH